MGFLFLHWASRLVLSGIFLYTGYIKLESPLQFAAVLSGYQLFPDWLILPLTDYFPWIEIGLGILLLVGWKIHYVAWGASGLVFMFLLVLTVTYMRGIEADCGCFSFDDRISPLTIGRDMLILLPAFFLAIEPMLRARLRPPVNPAREE